MITRRSALRTMALSSCAVALGQNVLHAQAPAPAPTAEGVYKLPPLGYDYDALEPFIDAETMKIHHDKHHAAYVSKLNTAVAKLPDKEKRTVEELLIGLKALPEEIQKDVQNQGGGHANHSLFWQTLKKNENGKPVGQLAKEIEKSFGSYDDFWKLLTEKATKVFGSGWAWLVVEKGKLAVTSSPNQDSPLLTGATPLLGIDVWEHAYYLKYQNRRPDYLAAFQKVINWEFVNERYGKVSKA
jgi:Fe-Mn family superoxide dismutase